MTKESLRPRTAQLRAPPPVRRGAGSRPRRAAEPLPKGGPASRWACGAGLLQPSLTSSWGSGARPCSLLGPEAVCAAGACPGLPQEGMAGGHGGSSEAAQPQVWGGLHPAGEAAADGGRRTLQSAGGSAPESQEHQCCARRAWALGPVLVSTAGLVQTVDPGRTTGFSHQALGNLAVRSGSRSCLDTDLNKLNANRHLRRHQELGLYRCCVRSCEPLSSVRDLQGP